MKSNAIVRIVIYSIVILLLIALLCTGLGIGMLRFDLGGSGDYITGEGSVDAAEIRNLEIDWAAGSIKIVTADTDQITFTEEGSAGEDHQMVYEVEGDSLCLQFSKPSFQIGFVSLPSKDLTITVPTDWGCQNIEIDAASVSVDILDLTVSSIELDGASNNLNFRGNLDKLDCDGASNSIEAVCSNTPSQINLGGASIELELTLPEDTGFRVDVDGLSCDFSSDFTTTSSDGSHVYGDGSCRINVDGVSCEINIRKGEAHTEHTWDKGTVYNVPGDGREELVYTCTVCGDTKSEPVNNPTIHAVHYADDATKEFIIEPLMANYYTGTTVTIKTDILYDTDLQLYIDGEYVCSQTPIKTGDAYSHWEFSFEMPDHDITIQLKTHGGM